MLKCVLLCLTLSGLQALPIAPRTAPGGDGSFPSGFRQGTEPLRRFLVDLNTGLVKEHVSEMERRAARVVVHPSLSEGSEVMERHWFKEDNNEVPAERSGAGWVRVEDPSAPGLPDGFKQGTEPVISIPDGFKQGTEPVISIPDGFKQGTEPVISIPDGFKQGTEPVISIPDGFKQGTEPVISIPDGFKQGTEPVISIPDGFKQGTEPGISIPDGFKQGTEPGISIPDGFKQGTEPVISIPDGFKQGTEPMNSISDGFRQGKEPSILKLNTGMLRCQGEIINGRCYQFNPTPLAFGDAQRSCRALAQNGVLASVTDSNLHSHLVSMVTQGGKAGPVLIWLGAVVKNQQGQWLDGSEWGYSDWMPGHPNIHSDKPICLEMFRTGESWWTAMDCELKRAFICSYPMTA